MSRTGKKKDVRPSCESLGLSPERIREIKMLCRTGKFDGETMRRACRGFEWISDFVIMSAVSGASFDRIEFNAKLGRVPCGRSDFYGYRRQFYSNLDKILKMEDGEA